MGFHASLILLRSDGSEFIETNKPYKGRPASEGTSGRLYIRDGVVFNRNTAHYLGCDESVSPWYGRGIPAGILNEEQTEEIVLGDYVTWFTMEEALAVAWDAPYSSCPIGGYRGTTRIEELGSDLKDWFLHLQSEGVVKVVVAVG